MNTPVSGHDLTRAPESPGLWEGDTSSLEVMRNLRSLALAAKWRCLYILAWTACLVALGVVYSAMVQPEYTSTIQILLQPRKVIIDGPEDRNHYHQFVLDNQQCETELALLTSQQLLRTVYRAMRIGDNPEVKGRFDGISPTLRTLFSPVHDEGVVPAEDFGFRRFVGRIRARRTGLSYILNVTYQAYDPERAAKVVGAIANAYVAGRMRSIGARYRESGPYLQRRVALLQEQEAEAEKGIETGQISDKDFRELDVRILGQPATTLSPLYPRRSPLVVTLAALGLVSGTLVFLFLTHRAGAAGNTPATYS